MGSLSLHPQPLPVEMGASPVTHIQVSLLQGVRSRGCSNDWPVAHPRSLETEGLQRPASFLLLSQQTALFYLQGPDFFSGWDEGWGLHQCPCSPR